jgi:hypothetical protein
MDQSLAQMGEVAKAFPALGLMAGRAATRIKPVQSSFLRGVKGRKLNPAKNPRSASAMRPITPMQMRANQAGMFVNRNRNVLTAAGVGAAAGGLTGYGTSRVDKALPRLRKPKKPAKAPYNPKDPFSEIQHMPPSLLRRPPAIARSQRFDGKTVSSWSKKPSRYEKGRNAQTQVAMNAYRNPPADPFKSIR